MESWASKKASSEVGDEEEDAAAGSSASMGGEPERRPLDAWSARGIRRWAVREHGEEGFLGRGERN